MNGLNRSRISLFVEKALKLLVRSLYTLLGVTQIYHVDDIKTLLVQ